MEIYISQQAGTLLLALALGAALGVLYDFFRASRVAFGTAKPLVFLEDILFCAAVGSATFLIMLHQSHGNLRGFILLGELGGFSLYYFTLGRFVFGATKKAAAALRTIFKTVSEHTAAPILRRLDAFRLKLNDMLNSGRKNEKKVEKS